jgi:outer membrane protein TolC
MRKVYDVMGDNKISNWWNRVVQQCQVMEFEGMIISTMVMAGRRFLPLLFLQKRLLRFSQQMCVGVLTLIFLSSLATAQAKLVSPQPPAGMVTGLTLRAAVEAALESNAVVQLSEEEERAAGARKRQARAGLLPNVSGQVLEANATENLKAQGLDFSKLPGFSQFSPFIGPFNRWDARAYVEQTLFNWGMIRQYQAAVAAKTVTQLEAEVARRETVALVAALYYGVLEAEARQEATEANIRLNQSLLELAEHQQEAGTGTAVDVTRAKVQLAQQRQRRLNDEVAVEEAKLRLLKAMGKGVGGKVELLDKLGLKEVAVLTAGEALAIAREHRVELETEAERERAARLQLSAVKGERLPTVGFAADYGSSGATPWDTALPTRTYGVVATVPLWDGGRREGRIAEQAVRVKQETIRRTDTEQQVEMEVRLAVKTVESAREQVAVSEENLKLAEQELELARDRFTEGVTNNIEVVTAQTSLEQARDQRVDALYLYSLAGVNLHRALGQVEKVYQ